MLFKAIYSRCEESLYIFHINDETSMWIFDKHAHRCEWRMEQTFICMRFYSNKNQHFVYSSAIQLYIYIECCTFKMHNNCVILCTWCWENETIVEHYTLSATEKAMTMNKNMVLGKNMAIFRFVYRHTHLHCIAFKCECISLWFFICMAHANICICMPTTECSLPFCLLMCCIFVCLMSVYFVCVSLCALFFCTLSVCKRN